MKNKIEDLRNHLFATLEALSPDQENPMDIGRAKAITEVAQAVINSAKVEVEYLRVRNGAAPGTAFFPSDATPPNPRLIRGA